MGEAATIIILGGAGDLALRKLLPALALARSKGKLRETTRIIAAGRRALTSESYRSQVSRALEGSGVSGADATTFVADLTYVAVPDPAGWRALAESVRACEAKRGLANRLIYMALPPQQVEGTLHALGAVGLSVGSGWVRLVVEKPFGHDLASAQHLNGVIHAHFAESAVYRIDHYLGKETVQNLLVLRFANALFESLWHRDRIEAVEIMVAESAGVGSRAGYYDQVGAVRDMLQNHLLQILTLVAMEVPAKMQADAIRHEKLKVLQSLVPLGPEALVVGQYGPGQVGGVEVAGYQAEAGVRAGSPTETYAALRVEIDNWRWQGVPFYLVTGKRMPDRLTRIAVRFRRAPVCLFESMGTCMVSSNVLVVTLQPNEGFSLHIDVKVPGSPMALRQIPLRFAYDELGYQMPEAYETLLVDVVRGDQTLFVHADEVEHAWRYFSGLSSLSLPLHTYDAGTWGPSAALSHGIWERRLVTEV